MTAAEESLRSIRDAFKNAALGRDDLRHSIYVTETSSIDVSSGPVTDLDAAHGANAGFDYILRYSKDRYWQCRFQYPPDRTSVDPFWDLARAAGKACRGIPSATELMADSVQLPGQANDDLWTILLYKLAWRAPEDSPLTCFSYRVTEGGRVAISAEEAQRIRVGLQAQLAEDPFLASAFAIDILIGDSFQRNDVPLSDTGQDALIAMLELGALNVDSRRTAAEIAERALGDYDRNKVKKSLAKMKRKGLVGSVQGRDGGYWLTSAGEHRARSLTA